MRLLRSLKSLEVVLDHIDIALLILQLLVIDRLVACLHDFDLLYVSLTHAFQAFLQEVPEDEVHQSIHYKDCPVQRLWEHS